MVRPGLLRPHALQSAKPSLLSPRSRRHPNRFLHLPVCFLVRRTFVRLIAADLHAIRFSINELEQRGVRTVNCVRAGLGPLETLDTLRQVCQEWKKPFRAAYAAGQNFRELIEIRGAVEEALALAPEKGSITVPPGADFSQDAMRAVSEVPSNGTPRAPEAPRSPVSEAIASFATQPAPPKSI